MNEMKNAIQNFYSRIEKIEDIVSGPEVSGPVRGRTTKMNENFDLWDFITCTNIRMIEITGEKPGIQGQEVYLNK